MRNKFLHTFIYDYSFTLFTTSDVRYVFFDLQYVQFSQSTKG
jgi:hypothetical protein